MNKTKIEWCDYTWNPLIGCRHGCKYCYAKRLNSRFNFIPKWETPIFFPDRVNEPTAKRKGAKIFVCSMSDLFGNWVRSEWITKILHIAAICPRHEFMFLTKNPDRYQEFAFPSNCWLGRTITAPPHPLADVARIDKPNKTFISVEPLLGDFSDIHFDVDLVIVGAMTGPGAVIPKREWIKSIRHPNIFYKDNIKKYL